MLLWGSQGPDGGRKLYIQGVFQLYGRIHFEHAEEDTGVAWTDRGNVETGPIHGDATVPDHPLKPNRHQFFLPAVGRNFLDDELIRTCKGLERALSYGQIEMFVSPGQICKI